MENVSLLIVIVTLSPLNL